MHKINAEEKNNVAKFKKITIAEVITNKRSTRKK